MFGDLIGMVGMFNFKIFLGGFFKNCWMYFVGMCFLNINLFWERVVW